jgi:Domain of unknown function (DUF3859)
MFARLALVLLFASYSGAGKSQPSAQITDCGTYSAVVLVQGNWKLGKPVSIASVDDLAPLKPTTNIEARDGVYWGFRANLVNPLAREVKIVCKITHPPITSPDGKTSTEDDSGEKVIGAGQTATAENMWFFISECPYEFVPGKWKLSIECEGKVLVEKEFDVHAPADGAGK